MSYFIRAINVEDSLSVIELLNKLDGETPFSIYTPGERPLNSFQLASAIALGSQTLFGAESFGKLIGCLLLFRDAASRVRHNALLSVGVLREHWGKGGGAVLDVTSRRMGKTQ